MIIFKGSSSYEEEDRDSFYGRSIETQELYYLVSNNDISVCYAESGEGKSSLINAGLCPLLRKYGMFPVLVRFGDDGDDIYEIKTPDFDTFVWSRLEKEIEAKRSSDNDIGGINYQTLELYKSSITDNDHNLSKSLCDMLQTHELRLNSYETLIPVFIFDQFEEVFTRPKDISWTKNFFEWLEALSQHLSTIEKRFKILLSLRSEYVCELDYWSMSQYFIPSVKNNRYYLKPLTKNAAYAVIDQKGNEGEGIIESILAGLDVKKAELLNLVKIRRIEDLSSVEDNVPCISALMLSLILSKLERKDDKILKLKTNNESGKLFFDKLLKYIYEEALMDSGIDDYSQELLEDILLDAFGNRRRVPANELVSISKVYLEKLKTNRIINEIAGCYEISHDSLCSVMSENRKERKDRELEEAEKLKIMAEAESIRLKSQREEIIASSLITLFSIFVIWFLTHCFCNIDVYNQLSSDKEHILISIITFTDLVFIPLLIYAVIKKFSITSLFSTFTFLINALALFFFNHAFHKDYAIGGILLFGFMLSSALFFYSLYCRLFRREDILITLKSTLYSLPFLVYILILSIFVFILCVFNNTLGIPEPKDSCWGIIVIPMILFTIFRKVTLARVKRMYVTCFITLLGLLAYNTAFPFLCSNFIGIFDSKKIFAFPFEIVSILLVFILFIIWKICLKRIIVGLTLSIVVLAIMILNFGFWPIAVDYNRIKHVSNWRQIVAYNDSLKYGICSPCGEEIYPFVFDSIKIGGGDSFVYLTTNRFKYDEDSAYSRGLVDNSANKNVTICKFLNNPGDISEMYRVSRITSNDSILDSLKIQTYAAKAIMELIKANTSSLQTGKMFTINSTPSLLKLIELQKKELYTTLYDWHKLMKMDSLGVTFTNKIHENEILKFNKAFARLLCISLIKEMIAKEAIFELIPLLEDFELLYFYSSFNGKLNFNYIMKRMDDSIIDSTCINTRRLKNEDIDYWYRYVRIMLYNDRIKNQSYYTAKLLSVLSDIDEAQKKANQLIEGKSKNILSVIKLSAEIKEIKSKLLNDLKVDGAENDIFELVDTIYKVLPSIVENTHFIYNAELSDILGGLSSSIASRPNLRSKKYYKWFVKTDSLRSAKLLKDYEWTTPMDSLIKIIESH